MCHLWASPRQLLQFAENWEVVRSPEYGSRKPDSLYVIDMLHNGLLQPAWLFVGGTCKSPAFVYLLYWRQCMVCRYRVLLQFARFLVLLALLVQFFLQIYCNIIPFTYSPCHLNYIALKKKLYFNIVLTIYHAI